MTLIYEENVIINFLNGLYYVLLVICHEFELENTLRNVCENTYATKHQKYQIKFLVNTVTRNIAIAYSSNGCRNEIYAFIVFGIPCSLADNFMIKSPTLLAITIAKLSKEDPTARKKMKT
jgi:hypothetical protein